MKSLLKKIILHTILPLVVGVMIYVWAAIPIKLFYVRGEGLQDTRMDKIQEYAWFERILILSGPDFCWSYSFASALFIWKSYSGSVSFLFFTLVVAIMSCSELIQLFFPGYFTFDISDLVAAILATGLSYFLNTRNV